jgi:transposase-like protein
MSETLGTTPISAKVSEDMTVFVDERATSLGITRSELVRRVLQHYRDSHDGQLTCPYCDGTLRVEL